MNRMDKEDWKVRLVGLQKTKFMGHLTLMPNGKLSRIERPFLTVPVTHERRLTQTNKSNLLKLAFKLKVKKKCHEGCQLFSWLLRKMCIFIFGNTKNLGEQRPQQPDLIWPYTK